MELSQYEEQYKNKNGDILDIEDDYVFPLVKSSSFKDYIIKDDFKKYVIVTQKKVREDTSLIKNKAPKTWNYLSLHKPLFEKRKSSIYVGAPDFSMFGVGDYSYSKYKVGISGFYKKPIFSLVFNENNLEKPVMFDDTSYFLSFDNYEDAYACMLLFNSELVQRFLLTISFQDSKRPYTKKVLQRLSLSKCVNVIKYSDLKKTEKDLKVDNILTEDMYGKFKNNIPLG